LPAVLSLQKENQICRVVGHKTPRDGSQYWHDIETLFPARTHEEIDALIGGPNFWREELKRKLASIFNNRSKDNGPLVSFRKQRMIFWNNHALFPKAYETI